MKKLVSVIILGMLLVVGAIAVSADSPSAAIVIKHETCWVPDGTGSLEFEDLYEIPDCCSSVITNSHNDVWKFYCHCQLPPEAVFPDKTLRLTYESTGGFECWLAEEGPYSPDYQITITPTGMVNFYCVFKG